MKFEWDTFNIREVEAHGVTRTEFEQVMKNDPMLLDSRYVGEEWRDTAIGHTDAFRILVVVSVEKAEELVRPITAYEPKASTRWKYQEKRSR